jgi:hypothetical protein
MVLATVRPILKFKKTTRTTRAQATPSLSNNLLPNLPPSAYRRFDRGARGDYRLSRVTRISGYRYS